MPVIATNTAANTALRYLNKNSSAQASYLAKLSSGSRIERASDDAAGLAVGTTIKTDVTSLEQAAINAQHGQSVLQAADGGLARVADILQRMKSLATQSLSGIVGDTTDGRDLIDAEYQELVLELDSIAGSTRFNGAALLDGSYNQSFLVGTDGSAAAAATDRIAVDLSTVGGAAATGVAAADLGVNGSVDTAANAETETAAIDAAITTISTARANVGAMISRFEFRGEVIATSIENLSASESVIMDADIAAMQTEFTSAQTLTDAAIAALGRANQMPQKLLDLMQ